MTDQNPQKKDENQSPHFDIDLIYDSFSRSICELNAIDVSLYLQGFSELIKFFDIFGKLFAFVSSDVIAKIEILQSYAQDKEVGFNYKTVQTMIEYESSQNLLTSSKRPSGCRTLLRLHRALEFISQFLHQVTELNNDERTGTAACKAYDNTLANYHPWYIKKLVYAATFTLPKRGYLIEKVYCGKYLSGEAEQVNENMSQLANMADKVFNVTQELYEKHNLLDLP